MSAVISQACEKPKQDNTFPAAPTRHSGFDGQKFQHRSQRCCHCHQGLRPYRPRAQTMSARPADTLWTSSKPAFAVSRPTTSTSTRSRATTQLPPLRRPCLPTGERGRVRGRGPAAHDGVVGLKRVEAGKILALRDPEGFGNLPRLPIGDAKVAHLALRDERVERTGRATGTNGRPGWDDIHQSRRKEHAPIKS